MMARERDYDIALSFAGEDRAYVEAVAQDLRAQGVKVFYDRFEEVDLWGKDLYSHLSDLYRGRARFTIMFISKAYGEKLWTNHERKAAQARAFEEAREYILPVRFDDTEVPGLLATTGYLSVQGKPPKRLAELIVEKLARSGVELTATPKAPVVERGAIPASFDATGAYDRPGRSSIATPEKVELVSDSGSRTSTTAIRVHVRDDHGSPIRGCEVVAVADNGTTVRAQTNENGAASVQVPTQRTYSILFAHSHYKGSVRHRIHPGDIVEASLTSSPKSGSLVIRGVGYIPGLSGRINPIHDAQGRSYFYAGNISIGEGKRQPVSLVIDDPIQLEDANGKRSRISFKFIAGHVSLLDYTVP